MSPVSRHEPDRGFEAESRTSPAASLMEPSFYSGNPYPTYHALRATEPVAWCTSGQFWAVTKHRDAVQILSQPERFISSRGTMIGEPQHRKVDSWNIPFDADLLLKSDPPRHTVYRGLVAGTKAFTRNAAYALEADIRRIVTGVVDGLDPSRVTDFGGAIGFPVAAQVMARFSGLPPGDAPLLKRWSLDLGRNYDASSADSRRCARNSALAFWEYLSVRVRERSNNLGDDLVSRLIGARRGAERLNEHTIIYFLMDMILAGFGVTEGAMSGGVLALLQHPDQRRRLEDDRSLLSTATEETLRWIAPSQSYCRTLTEDASVGGTSLRAGEYVAVFFSSANRDEEIWPDGEAFRIDRAVASQHLSFGYGRHLCLGAHIARAEIRILLEELIRRYPTYGLAEEPIWARAPSGEVVRKLPLRLAG